MRAISLMLLATTAYALRTAEESKKPWKFLQKEKVKDDNLTSGAAFKSTLREVPGLTLRKWIQQTGCLNMASLPLLNTQFAQLGFIDALEKEHLMDKVTGLAGVSSGAFVTSLAATKNRTKASEEFRKIWPGWMNMGATKDPEFSQVYQEKVLDKVLPKTFEELKVPLAIVAVHYADDQAAQTVDGSKADPVVISDGPLAESVIVSSSAMMGPGCPKCSSGFQAKNFRGLWPTADGFLKDEYGTMGLNALAPCSNLLHIMPQNFPGQLGSTPNADLDTQPTNVLSLGIDIPSSGLMSMVIDGLKQDKLPWEPPIFNLKNLREFSNGMIDPIEGMRMALGLNKDEDWEKIQYETALQHTKEMLDKPVMQGDEPGHYFVDLNLNEHWSDPKFYSQFESKFDNVNDGKHTEYWQKTVPRRKEMVTKRNQEIKAGKLSYRRGGNGKGAPPLVKREDPLAHVKAPQQKWFP